MSEGRKNLTLALQGGGSHGAFTWGVLDRLLEDDRIVIEGISGTSAGAMNAAVVVAGMAEGGAPAAQALLERFWEQVAESGRYSIFQPSLFDRMFGNPANLDFSPFYQGFDLLTRNPNESEIRAKPLIPAPPIPMKWIFLPDHCSRLA